MEFDELTGGIEEAAVFSPSSVALPKPLLRTITPRNFSENGQQMGLAVQVERRQAHLQWESRPVAPDRRYLRVDRPAGRRRSNGVVELRVTLRMDQVPGRPGCQLFPFVLVHPANRGVGIVNGTTCVGDENRIRNLLKKRSKLQLLGVERDLRIKQGFAKLRDPSLEITLASIQLVPHALDLVECQNRVFLM